MRWRLGDTVYAFAMDTLDPQNLLESLFVFGSLQCEAELNVAIGFVLKNVEDGSFGYYYAHKNNKLLELYKLVSTT